VLERAFGGDVILFLQHFIDSKTNPLRQTEALP
jgi:hypothetical protein